MEFCFRTAPEFLHPIYTTSIDFTASPDTELILPGRISLRNETSIEVYFGPVTDNDFITFVNAKEYLRGSFAKLYLSRRPKKFETKKEIYIGAFDRRLQKRVAMTKLIVDIRGTSAAPPVFESSVYIIEVKSVQAHSTLSRVKAK